MKSEAEFVLTCTVAPRHCVVQGAGLKSYLCCLSANVKGKISFYLTESVGCHSDEESLMDLLCGEGKDKESCHSHGAAHQQHPLRPHASCYTMKGATSSSPRLTSPPPSPTWNLTNHISTRNHSPFGSLHPWSLQDIDEAVLLCLVAFKIYRPLGIQCQEKNSVVAATAKESNYYLGRSVSPIVKKTKLYFITRLHQPH